MEKKMRHSIGKKKLELKRYFKQMRLDVLDYEFGIITYSYGYSVGKYHDGKFFETHLGNINFTFLFGCDIYTGTREDSVAYLKCFK